MKIKLLNHGGYGQYIFGVDYPVEVTARKTHLGYEVKIESLLTIGFELSPDISDMRAEEELFYTSDEVEVIS